MRVAQVLLPLPLPEGFDYALPEGLEVGPGDLVEVPLGPRHLTGVVEAVRETTGSNRRLREVRARLDLPSIPAETLAFVDWAARWSLAPPGEMAFLAARGLRSAPPRPIVRLEASGEMPERLTPARTRVLEALAQGPADGIADLAARAEVSDAVVRGLIAAGAVVRRTVLPQDEARADPGHAPARLNPAQAAALDQICQDMAPGRFNPVLLDGVTGSGKTEVYLEAIARMLADQPTAQALVLLPEIALTQAVIGRIAARFGVPPGEWHSGLPPARRRQVWEQVREGRCRVVVGARSALFLPFAELGLIVVDEEHDGAFKQQDGLIYQGRDLAVARARLAGATVVLASATPSLETLWNAREGRYRWVRLEARHGVARLPEIGLIDLRETPPETGRWLSQPLVEAMGQTLARGEQTLLFLNRRGYAPVVLCRACGERITAPDTDSWLVEHRYTGRLVCHLTGFSMPRPERCPHCSALDSLVAIGPGVERVEEEVKSLFPEARTAVFSSDTVPDAASARSLVERMASGQIDVLVATQAAAKGHNFPGLTLVGVVDADLGLRGGDLRAAERTFQLISQATGRAGRADRPGRALLQTWTPEHPVMQALKAGDRDGFVEVELAERALARMPPHGRLAALILSSPDAQALETAARALAQAVPNADRVEVYGPADAPLALIRGRRRKRFLVRADRDVDLQGVLRAWLAPVKLPAAVRLTVDVDPYSFL